MSEIAQRITMGQFFGLAPYPGRITEDNMAAGMIAKPGTEFGPCADDCTHTDCAQTRALADAMCQLCGEPIGYERRFYLVHPAPDVAHATCEEIRIEHEGTIRLSR
jgi:hypothetical protein